MQKSENSSDPNQEYLFLGDTPVWKWLKKAIIGEKRPSDSTRMISYLQWGIALFLISWHGLRFFALNNRAFIEQEKGVRVEHLIRLKAFSLGYSPKNFLQALEYLHIASVVCWACIMVGIALMYRQSNAYPLPLVIGLLAYFIAHQLLFSWGYYFYEVGNIEQWLVLISGILFGVHYIFLRKGKLGE
jgi:hypothetical protein